MTDASPPPTTHMRAKYRPGLRTILALLNMTVLVLPFAAIVLFRFYEAHLVRETETELIAQAALIGAFVKEKVREIAPGGADFGSAVPHEPAIRDGDYYPIGPTINLGRDAILPPRPAAVTTALAVDPRAVRIGATLGPVLKEAQRVSLFGVRLLDAQGVVIGGRGDHGLSYAHVQEVAAALTGHYAAVLRQRDSDKPTPSLESISRGARVRVFVAYPVVEAGRLWGIVYMSRTPDNVGHQLYFARDRVLIAAALIIALALAFAFLASRLIATPLVRLSERARALASGEPLDTGTLAHAGTREVATLADSISEMATALQLRAAYVRDFAAHVGHAFKTPLTSIQGAAELLVEHGNTMSPAERETFALNIAEDGERLSGLIARLNELARAEHAASVIETFDLGEALSHYAERGTRSGIAVTASAPAGLTVNASREGLGIVLDNLLANSAAHGASGVEIAARASAGGVRVRIADNGTGIPPDIAARIFEPFFTTRDGQGGTGVGLALSRSILANSGGTITLETSASGGRGAVFVISLPHVDPRTAARTRLASKR